MKKAKGPFFISVPGIIKKRLLLTLRIKNSRRIYVLSVIGFLFFFLFMLLDYIRFSEDKIQFFNIYFYLFINHLAFTLFIFPIITLRSNRTDFTIGRFKHGKFFIYSWTIFLGFMLITMAILSLIDRGDLTMYTIYIIVTNFGLIMLHRDRILLNLVSFIGVSITIAILYNQNLERLIINLLEASGVTATSFVVSTLIFNAYVREIHADKLLEIKNAQIEKEKNRSDKLLNNILPEDVANELKINGYVKPRHYSSATILLIDFKNFSLISKSLTPEKLVSELDYCFKKFDKIIAKHHLEKIKTMGDAYLCVGGLPEINTTHPIDCVKAAQEIIIFLEAWKKEQTTINEPFFEGRIGIHTGPVIAGVVGDIKFVFDIWGDAVNVVARVENSGEAGKINISQSTYDLIQHKFECIPRGKVSTKNQAPLDMYFVKGKNTFIPTP